jgi:hypothetical protein
MRFAITVSTLTFLTLASANVQLGSVPFNKLFARADVECDSGDVVCGETCIPESYTCCPDKLGGCKADEQCQMGDNDEYGCCPEGEICSGDGGAEFIDEKADGSRASSNSGSSGSSSGGAEDSSSGAASVKVAGSIVVAVAAAAALL